MAPSISLVVCIYNVERYLRECLDSIAAQTYTDFECILCDDESSDASGLIAEQFAATDSRFKYVRQSNRGPGPAGGRNGGIPYVTGEWLMFIDSDDILLPHALEIMYESAQRTGSELVIGGVDRFNSSNRWPSFLHQRVHIESHIDTTIDEYPEMVWDSTAWNKLIKTALWNDHIGFFDEGRLYEDLYPMIRLMCLANSVDILDETIYLWRDREAKTSVTQQVASTRGLVDKVDQMLKLDAFLVETNNTVAKQAQDEKLLSGDIMWMLDDLDRGDDEFQTAFWAEVPALVQAMSANVRAKLPSRLRHQYELVCDGDKSGLAKARRSNAADVLSPQMVQDSVGLGKLQSTGENPPDPDRITELFARATDVSIQGDHIVVKGYVALDRVRLKRDQAKLQVWFESWESGQRVWAETELLPRPRLHLTRQGPQLHRYTGFQVSVPASELVIPDNPVGKVIVGASIDVDGTKSGTTQIVMPEHRDWHVPRSAGQCAVQASRDGWGNLSLEVAHAVVFESLILDGAAAELHFERAETARVCLFDPSLKRRWMAAATPGPTKSVRFELANLPVGDYQLQLLQESRAYEDGWVPLVSASPEIIESDMGDRVMRWHIGSGVTQLEIAESASELRDLDATKRFDLDAKLTELARQINKYTWI